MKRRICLVTVLIVLCSLFLGIISISASEPENTLTITFLDVGKGDCILLQKDDYNVLIDAGYDYTSEDVIAYLKQNNAEHLDCFFITHYDKDHVGGAGAVLENVDVETLYLPGYNVSNKYHEYLTSLASQYSLNVKNVTKDLSFMLGDMDFTIHESDVPYVSEQGKEGNDNDASLVITVHWEEDSYLFSGDLEKEGIEAFLADGHGTYDVVKMPHHGVKEGNTDEFIDSVQPKIAIITDSEEDEAHKKVLKWLEKAGADVYQTSECGNIVVTGTGTGEYTVNTQR